MTLLQLYRYHLYLFALNFTISLQLSDQATTDYSFSFVVRFLYRMGRWGDGRGRGGTGVLGSGFGIRGQDQYHLVLWLCFNIHPLHMT